MKAEVAVLGSPPQISADGVCGRKATLKQTKQKKKRKSRRHLFAAADDQVELSDGSRLSQAVRWRCVDFPTLFRALSRKPELCVATSIEMFVVPTCLCPRVAHAPAFCCVAYLLGLRK